LPSPPPASSERSSRPSSPLLQARQAARIADVAKRREQLTDVYVDAMRCVQTLWAVIEARGEPLSLPQSPNVTEVTARMRLLAPEPVVEAWLDLVLVNGLFGQDLNALRLEDGATAERLAEAVNRMQEVLRTAAE
jgi:hypothetical protein